jgi:hypothetical protein
VTLQPPTIQMASALAGLFPIKCDAGCLKDCAPNCLYCGTDWKCWGICSALCFAKCCSI